MIRSVLYLHPRAGMARMVADLYRDHGVLDRAVAQEGCVSAELQLPLEDSGRVLVTALWQDRDAYQRWVENPARSTYAQELEQLLEHSLDGIRGDLYEIAVQAGAAA